MKLFEWPGVDVSGSLSRPLVVKFNGLANGKGVFVAKTLEEFVTAVETCRYLGERKMSDDGNNTSTTQTNDGDAAVSSGTTTSGADYVDSAASSSTVSATDGEDLSRPTAGGTTEPEPVLTINPPAADPAGDAKRATISAFVEEWWNDHFPGSVVGRSTEIWNYLHGAKEALKTKMDGWLASTNPPPPPPTDQ